MTRSIRLSLRRLASLRDGQRAVTAVVMMVAIAGVLTGVSWSRTSQLAGELDRIERVVMPAGRAAHTLTTMVDEARGMEALLLLTDDTRERRTIDERLAQQRQRIRDRVQLQTQPAAPVGADERRHLDAVRATAEAWWVEQDRVIAAVRQPSGDTAHAAAARALMTGPSQQAYRRLQEALEAWWRHHDAQAAAAAGKARTTLLLAAQVALAMAACFALGAMLLGLMSARRLALAASSAQVPRGDALAAARRRRDARKARAARRTADGGADRAADARPLGAWMPATGRSPAPDAATAPARRADDPDVVRLPGQPALLALGSSSDDAPKPAHARAARTLLLDLSRGSAESGSARDADAPSHAPGSTSTAPR